MPKKGALSPKTYFPLRGDVLLDTENKTLWECVRSHAHRDDGRKVHYALLKGWADSQVVWYSAHDFDRNWLSTITQIKRPTTAKKYDWSHETKTWQEAT